MSQPTGKATAPDVAEEPVGSTEVPAAASSAAATAATAATESGNVAAIEPEEEGERPIEDDGDSALEMFDTDSTTSMMSSIRQYRIENGRSYHSYKDGKYIIPNDEAENDRLDLQHHMFALTFDGALGLCPMNHKDQKVKRCLDIGTGTGIWAIDFADEHPEAEVVGVDLSPIQPSFVPPNLTFEIDDIEEPWTFTKKFDYIHSRMMTGSFANWPKFFAQCYEHLEPGGWLELQDLCFPCRSDDGTLLPDSALAQWSTFMIQAGNKFGRQVDILPYYKPMLEEAGFKNITSQMIQWPQNPWPKDKKFKELGAWTQENLVYGCEGICLRLFTAALGWTKEEVDVHLMKVRTDMKDTRIHAYWPIWVYCCQK